MSTYYFDNMATTPLYDEVIECIYREMKTTFANPSSVYRIAQRSKLKLQNAREFIARYIHAESRELFFSSCASESNNWAIKIALENNSDRNHIITTTIEHPSVLNTIKEYENNGYDVTYLSVDNNGYIDINELQNCVSNNTALISVMFVNNEIGTIQDIKKIAEIAKEYGCVFHSDAVQAIKYFDIDVKELGVDLMSFSAHKANAPKGIGALYANKRLHIKPMIFGGSQERSQRAGTENLYSIIGFHKALEIISARKEEIIAETKEKQAYFINRVLNEIDDVILNGDDKYRHPANCHFSFKNVSGESLLLLLDMNGICASSGSACGSGSLKISHVVEALGIDEEYKNGSIRFSIDEHTTYEEIDYVVETTKKEVEKLRGV